MFDDKEQFPVISGNSKAMIFDPLSLIEARFDVYVVVKLELAGLTEVRESDIDVAGDA